MTLIGRVLCSRNNFSDVVFSKKILFFLLFITAHIFGQSIKNDSLQQQKNPRFKYQSLIIPASLITYGVIGLESHQLKFLNSDIKNEINEHIDTRFTIDDISQYTPFLSVDILFGLAKPQYRRDSNQNPP